MPAAFGAAASLVLRGAPALLLILGACADKDPTPIVADTGARPVAVARAEKAPPDYKLGPSDRMKVTVEGQPILTGDFVLDDKGAFTYPILGAIEARGKTAKDLERTITEKLEKDYLSNPSVDVAIARRSPFQVVGEVIKPGRYSYSSDMTVQMAVATAGGETYRANMKSFFIRREQDGQPVRVVASGDTAVHPGDTVVVQERHF
jgi:polysaccharide export outer membrane protein